MKYIYGGESCHRLSEHLADTDDSLCIIFSIVSDDRLPFELATIISHFHENECESYDIHILGDLVGLPLEQWRVRNYLMHELSLYAKNKKISLFWYDGDKIREGHGFFIRNPLHTDNLIHSESHCNRGEINYSDANLKEICFLDERGYPVNRLLNKTKKEIGYIFDTISELPAIEKIVCPFIDGLQIGRLPGSLKILDLRGCAKLDITPQCIPLTLEKINLSACGLISIPDFVHDLEKLNTLFLYKNALSVNGFFDTPKSLEFLSLYRNKIKRIELDVARLKKVNLGANPLAEISIKGGSENVAIGLRKVNCERLVIIHRNPVTIEF